ncbi:MAG: PrsW family intramembrane metalloprotease [Lachnospiraceae bacterium]|nr:PrsW family intramembrane metalloprotease [Lachnospiraceae bacterium]
MIYAENILLCISIPLLVSLIFVRGEARRYVASFLLGMGMSLLAAYIGGFLNLVTGMGDNDTAIFLSPVIEELMKLAPLLFVLIIFDPEDRQLTLLAAAIGAGFATFENCCYILTSGAESITYVLIRGLAVGVMHIVSIFAMAIWLIVAKRLKVLSFSAVVGGLALSMIFHALYNLLVSEPGMSSSIGYALPLVTASALYLLYRKITKYLKE